MIDLEVKGTILQPLLLILPTWFGKMCQKYEFQLVKSNFDIDSIISKHYTVNNHLHYSVLPYLCSNPQFNCTTVRTCCNFWGLEKKGFKTLLPQSRSAVVVPFELFFKPISLTKLQCTSYSILWKFFFML